MAFNDENSTENMAYTLFTHMAFAEKKALAAGENGDLPTKAWILDTFAECLRTVRGPRPAGQI